MINDSRISNRRKKELEQPDPFLVWLNKMVETARQYQKQGTIALAVLIAIVCIGSGTVYMIQSSENKASEMLANALDNYDNMSPEEGYEAVKGQFETLLETYPNTASGRMAVVHYGEVAYSAEKYDKAYDLFKRAMDEFEKDPVVKELLLFSLGHTCQALQKQDEAKRYFSELESEGSDFMKQEASFQIGMMALKQRDRQKGLEQMEKVVSSDVPSMHKTMADNILARN